jgi:hypothetical protein
MRFVEPVGRTTGRFTITSVVLTTCSPPIKALISRCRTPALALGITLLELLKGPTNSFLWKQETLVAVEV